MLSSILEPAYLELETDQNVYRITSICYIRWHIDADLEVFHTCVRNYVFSWVEYSRQFDVIDVEKALEKLKKGKASGFDGIVKEHLVYSHPSVIVYLIIAVYLMILELV